MEEAKSLVRDYPDFPKKGSVFKDITLLLADGPEFANVLSLIHERYVGVHIERVVGIGSHGAVLAAALAYALGVGCVIAHKDGNHPYKTYKKTYSLDDSTASIEINQGVIKKGERVVVIDDVLATGSTMAATVDLIASRFKAEIVEVMFFAELDSLQGRKKLSGHPVHSLIHF